MASSCHIQVRLLTNGAMSMSAEILGRSLRAGDITRPTDALSLLEEWLEPQEHEPIVIIVRGQRDTLATWNTQSKSFALYWAAAVLGHALETVHERTQQETDFASAVEPEAASEQRQRFASGIVAKVTGPDPNATQESSPEADVDENVA